VVVKAHVVRMNPRGAKAAALHLRYIAREGVEKDGSKGVPYTADGPARTEAFEQPRAGERNQFRLIVSPEDAAELDLTAYVGRFMARVERDLDRKLEWLAVNHYNTDHPHAHIVIRGVDRHGRELRLDRGYISNGLRWCAQEIATEELGPRLDRDVERTHAKEVTQERFTSLDRELERRTVESHVEVPSWRRPGRIEESMLVARLEHLEGLRLAERVSPSLWSLREGWQGQLREMGSRGDILKQMHAALSGDPARYRILGEGQALAPEAGTARTVIGRVARKGLSDELAGRFYAVIETPTGHGYRVPLDPRSAEELRPGDLVSLVTRPERAIRAVDRRIADGARAQGGVFALEGGDARVGAVRHRLRELERLGLVGVAGPDRWTVPPHLLEALEARHRPAPTTYRLFIRKEPLSLPEAIQHAGLVWLDRIDPAALAPYGFGAHLRRALCERRGVLHSLGVAGHGPDRAALRHERERRAVGEQMAALLGQAFLVRAPERFRGRVQMHMSPSGDSYALVSDGSRFAVLPTSTTLRALKGVAVVVSRDSNGGLVVRPEPDRGIGS
jgi:type IV secretory pathway VirD2 relaxase